MNSLDYQIAEPLPRGLTPGVMPDAFRAPFDEVAACRGTAALFDYSFLLRLRIVGAEALKAVSILCGRDFSSLPIGAIRYALHADRQGWLVSDLTIWRTGLETLEIMSGRAADIQEITDALSTYDIDIFDLSDKTGVLAVQGPQTDAVLSSVDDSGDVAAIPFFGFSDLHLFGAVCRVGRLGFTGLDGVEIVCAAEDTPRLWRLLAARAQPAGFMAADQLRISAGLALFSKEFRPQVSAADAGLKRVRPEGTSAADRASARVTRVCFSARIDAAKCTEPAALTDIEWSPQNAFPPKPGTLAVTSLVRQAAPGQLDGMGYLAYGADAGAVSEPTGVLSDIHITRRFPAPP